METGYPEVCPSCGSYAVTSWGTERLECDRCGHKWGCNWKESAIPPVENPTAIALELSELDEYQLGLWNGEDCPPVIVEWFELACKLSRENTGIDYHEPTHAERSSNAF